MVPAVATKVPVLYRTAVLVKLEAVVTLPLINNPLKLSVPALLMILFVPVILNWPPVTVKELPMFTVRLLAMVGVLAHHGRVAVMLPAITSSLKAILPIIVLVVPVMVKVPAVCVNPEPAFRSPVIVMELLVIISLSICMLLNNKLSPVMVVLGAVIIKMPEV